MKEAGLRVTITKEDLEKAVDSINKKLLTIAQTMKGVTSHLPDLTNKAGLAISQMGDDAAKGFSKGTAALQKLNSVFGHTCFKWQRPNIISFFFSKFSPFVPPIVTGKQIGRASCRERV